MNKTSVPGLIVAGVDIGSTMTKVVIKQDREHVLLIRLTGPEYRRLAFKVMEEALEEAGLSYDQIDYVVSTGYGRMSVPFADRQITEITCHARGVRSLFPSARTVIDIGGQDSKAIKLGPHGEVSNFVMNDKCAAGTGRFLEVLADTLRVRLEDLGDLALAATNPVRISSVCTVFAEHEAIAHMAQGASIEDVIQGVHNAIVSRIYYMAERIGIEPAVVLTGGGGKNKGIRQSMEERLGYSILIPPEPLITGALGAALLAEDIARRALEQSSPLVKGQRILREVKFFEQQRIDSYPTEEEQP